MFSIKKFNTIQGILVKESLLMKERKDYSAFLDNIVAKLEMGKPLLAPSDEIKKKAAAALKSVMIPGKTPADFWKASGLVSPVLLDGLEVEK